MTPRIPAIAARIVSIRTRARDGTFSGLLIHSFFLLIPDLHKRCLLNGLVIQQGIDQPNSSLMSLCSRVAMRCMSFAPVKDVWPKARVPRWQRRGRRRQSVLGPSPRRSVAHYRRETTIAQRFRFYRPRYLSRRK